MGMRIGWVGLMALALALAARGQDIDGKAQYEMLCGACHGADGRGASAEFPPLQGSEWIQGDPERMIQVILHGLEGPVTVKGKTYNLAMPPQGAALDDDQIVAIVNYVRGQWGEDEGTVTLDEVAKARKHTEGRGEMWKDWQLLKRWPLPSQAGPIKNLIASVYKGTFKTMPDFEKLELAAVEEEHSGLIDVAQAGLKDHFAVVWEGDLKVASKGRYRFRLNSDDGSRVFVNGKEVVRIDGLGPMKRQQEGAIELEPGIAKLRVEYFEHTGEEGISLSWGKGGKLEPLSQGRQASRRGRYSPHPLVVSEKARIYRNFIEGTGARSIGVGYPGGVNLAFDADELSLGLAWVGDFIDAGLHWTARGQGSQVPAGQRIIELGGAPGFALDEGGGWPTDWQKHLTHTFRGYRLDEMRRPTFRYEVGGVNVEDKPQNVGSDELVRSLVLQSRGPAELMMRLAGQGVRRLGSHHYDLGEGVHLEIAQSNQVEPILSDGALLLRLKLKKGENRLGLRYMWK